MIVVRMLLNSWATLLARAPTLLSFWAWSSCCRSWSASVLGTITSSPIMQAPPGSRCKGYAVGKAGAAGGEFAAQGNAVRQDRPEGCGGRFRRVGHKEVSAAGRRVLHPQSLDPRTVRRWNR